MAMEKDKDDAPLKALSEGEIRLLKYYVSCFHKILQGNW